MGKKRGRKPSREPIVDNRIDVTPVNYGGDIGAYGSVEVDRDRIRVITPCIVLRSAVLEQSLRDLASGTRDEAEDAMRWIRGEGESVHGCDFTSIAEVLDLDPNWLRAGIEEAFASGRLAKARIPRE